MRESSVPQGIGIFPHAQAKFVGLNWHRMAVTVEMQNTGDSTLKADVVASIEHALADRPGDWRVSIVGFQADDQWGMKIIGANAFERAYTLEGISHARFGWAVVVGWLADKMRWVNQLSAEKKA